MLTSAMIRQAFFCSSGLGFDSSLTKIGNHFAASTSLFGPATYWVMSEVLRLWVGVGYRIDLD